MLGGVGQAGSDRVAQQRDGQLVAVGLDHAQPVPVRAHPRPRGVEHLARHGPRREPAVVDVDDVAVDRVHHHRVAAPALHLGGQVPVADRLAVDRGQRRPPGGQRLVELPRRGARAAGLQVRRPGRRAAPARPSSSGPGTASGCGSRARGSRPRGTRTPTGCSPRRARRRCRAPSPPTAARRCGRRPPRGGRARWRRRRCPGGRRRAGGSRGRPPAGRLADHVPARGHVALAGLRHAGADAGLQVLAGGHRCPPSPRGRDPRARAAGSEDDRTRRPPRTSIPSASARPGGVDARSGGQARRSAAPDPTS